MRAFDPRTFLVTPAVALVCLLPAAPETQLRASAAQDEAATACPGAKIAPDRVIIGSFTSDRQGSYVMVPFDVPAGTTAVRVKYCWDAPENRPDGQVNHTLDLGLYEPRRGGRTLWGGPEFRGWGGSSHPDVVVSPEGYGPQDVYLATPKVNTPGKTTRGFRPGPIPAGRWAVELGLGAIVPRAEGDADGSVKWRIELELARDPAFADEPYRPAAYDARPARTQAGWYAGDFHVHGEHSALGDATMREVTDYAFRPIAQGGAGLDFFTLSDYVAGASWSEIGRTQAAHPGKLTMRSAEVITYEGHWNSHANTTFADYRAGAVLLRGEDGSLTELRGRRAPGTVMREIRDAGGFVQINHPTIFPSAIGAFRNLCRGCPWDHSPATSGEDALSAVEVITGPGGIKTSDGQLGPNPFVVTAIDFWQSVLDRGHKVAAVGSSDSHNAGRVNNAVTQTPIGDPTTVVHADELSERGIQRGVEAGHTYVKLTGNDGPDLRFTATVPGAPRRPEAIIGETVDADRAAFTATVIGGAGRTLEVYRGRRLLRAFATTGARSSHTFASAGDGRYWLQLRQGTTIEAVSSPIYLGDRDPLRVRVDVPARLALRGRTVTAGCRASGTDVRTCRLEVRVRAPRRRGERRGRVVTVARGSVPVTGAAANAVPARVSKAFRARLRRAGRSGLRATLVAVAEDREGRSVTAARSVRLRAR